MTRKSQSITLSLGEGSKPRLEQIALDLGCTWGDKPNISGLLDQIANGSLRVDRAETIPADGPRRAAIMGAIALIQDGLSKLLSLLA